MSLSGDVRYASRNARLFDDNIIIYINYFILITHSTYNCGRLISDLDLIIQAAVARVSALHASQKEKKPSPEKKLRGKKAAAAAKSD